MLRKYFWLALSAAALGIAAWQIGDAMSRRALFVDFRAFYCAGWTVLHGGNAYAAYPLFNCEQAPAGFGLYAVHVPLIAPFPGYELLAFSLAALLAYVPAAALWLVLLLACSAASSVLLARLANMPLVGGIALTSVALAAGVIPYGQLAPIVLCALCATALALRNGKVLAVVAGLAVIALEPNLALPVFLAVFVWRKELRLPVAALCAVLFAAHVAVLGPANALIYFTRVLPAHAASEVHFVNQYSITWIASALGAPASAALLAGGLCYALASLAGVYVCGVLARRFGDVAFVAVIPAAWAVAGGSYVHYSEIVLALPACALLFSRSRGWIRGCAAASAILIALPWLSVVMQPAMVLPAVAAAGCISLAAFNLNLGASLRVTLAAAAFSALVLIAAVHFGPALKTQASAAVPASASADVARAAQIEKSGSSAGAIWWLVKFPAWLGLIGMVSASAGAARQRS